MLRVLLIILAGLLGACEVVSGVTNENAPSTPAVRENFSNFGGLQEALYDERRRWEFCDGVDFGCIIDPNSRHTITIQLEHTALVGYHGIWSGKKDVGYDAFFHEFASESLYGEESYELARLLYPQTNLVWEREMSRLRK